MLEEGVWGRNLVKVSPPLARPHQNPDTPIHSTSKYTPAHRLQPQAAPSRKSSARRSPAKPPRPAGARNSSGSPSQE